MKPIAEDSTEESIRIRAEPVAIGSALILMLSSVLSSAIAAGPSPAQRSMRQMPFEIASNKPWVQVRINGSAPQTFILDTGSARSSIIARECADRLHLKLGDENQTSLGGGQGVKVAFTYTLNPTLDIAGDTLHVPGLGVFPLAHVNPYEGRRVDGLLGVDFMQRHVVGIDYPRRTFRTYDPDAYHYAGASTPLPIEFHGGLVVAQAVMKPPGRDPIPCQVVID